MAFPMTPELTTFTGTEDPLSDGGRWLELRSATADLRVAGGLCFPGNEGVYCGSYWTPGIFYAPVEVWGCTILGQLGAALETWRVAVWLGDTAALDGYEFYYGGAIGKGYSLRRYDGGSPTTLASDSGGYPEKLGLRVTADTVEGWAEDAGVWTQRVSVGDTSLRGPFRIAIALEEQGGTAEIAFACFGGGTIRKTQIYRYVSN